MSSVPVNGNGTKSSFPNSRFHNQHSTTTATCRRGNVVTNTHKQARTLAARHPKSTASSVVVTHSVPKDSQSSRIVVSVCCQTVKRAFVHFVSPFFRSRSSASAMASAWGLGSKPSTIIRRHRGVALQMLNCHWSRAKCLATRWASLIDDKNSRHCSVTMRTGSMSLPRSLTREDSNTFAWALRA